MREKKCDKYRSAGRGVSAGVWMRWPIWLSLWAVLQTDPVIAETWPTYGADAQRSFSTDNSLVLPLSLNWRHRLNTPLMPAWPEPGKELHRIDFDHGIQPVVGGGMVLFGSSSDHAVRALDLETGALRWRFVTGGPVRFAPHLSDDRAYVACDDGILYCLDLATGIPVWSRRLAPNQRMVIGNGQVTSRWPLRSGVALADGVLYVTAGMWPSEGVFVYALDAAIGDTIWVNDTCGQVFMDYPHTAEAVGGVAPQGYLAVADTVLLVSSGRGPPAGFDRATGELLYANVETHRNWAHGGSRVSVAGDFFFNPSTRGTMVHIRANPNEALPVAFEGTRVYRVADGTSARQYFLPATQPGGTNADYRILAAADRIFSVDSTGFLRALLMTDPEERSVRRRLWAEPFDGHRIYEMIWAGDFLILGDRNRILVHDAGTGKRLAEYPIDGQARGLAVAGGRLLVGTDQGTLWCFAPEDGSEIQRSVAPPQALPPTPWPPGLDTVRSALSGEASHGYALIDGVEDEAVATALAENAGLRVVLLARDADAVERLRTQLHDAGRPASGGPIQVFSADRIFDLPHWFADWVIADLDVYPDPATRLQALYALTQPYGGRLLLRGIGSESSLMTRAGIPAAEWVSDSQGVTILRGAPPAEEMTVTPPFEMVWFGGPGPNRMSDRHITDAPRPQTAAGRVVIVGENHLIAMNAFNGLELWEKPLYHACFREASTQGGQVEITAGDDIVRVHFEQGSHMDLDARTGECLRYFGLPVAEQRYALNRRREFVPAPDDADFAEQRGVHSRIALEALDDALEITLALTDPIVSLYDRFDLYFDFRDPAERFGLYGPGAFHLMVYPGIRYDRSAGVFRFLLENPRALEYFPNPAQDEIVTLPAFVLNGAGPVHPPIMVTGEMDGEGERRAVLRIPWDAVARLAGREPRDFAFAAVTRGCDNRIDKRNMRPYVWMRLAADPDAMRLNNGWPVFCRDTTEDGEYRSPALNHSLRFPVAAMPVLLTNRPPHRCDAHEKAPEYRSHPLTGAPSRRTLRPSYGCTSPISMGTVSYFRSATIAFYDFEEDAGVHAIGGIRPGCRDNSGILPAQGRLIYAERSSGCSCAYNFQTSFAMAPTQQPNNEYWALFYEEPAADAIRMIHMNLNAPGDRRDAQGNLWLGIPRPTNRNNPSLSVPAEWRTMKGRGFGPYRFNTDRRHIGDTDKPWIYGSGVLGLSELTLDLRRNANFIGFPATDTIVIDGKLDEVSWSGDEPDGQTILRIPRLLRDQTHWDRARASDNYASWAVARYDEHNLYLAFYDTARINRLGRAQQWRGNAEGHDDPRIFSDNRYEAFFSDRNRRRVVRLAVSCTGARYDALNRDLSAGDEDASWDGEWQGAATIEDEVFTVEMAVPWKTLADAGIDIDFLDVNLYANGQTPFRHRYMRPLGRYGHERAELFVPFGRETPRPARERRFRVTLHFVEIDDVTPGERVFDILLQGERVAGDVDIVALAGGRDRALTIQFDDVPASESMTLELRPRDADPTPRTAPILSGMHIDATLETTLSAVSE